MPNNTEIYCISQKPTKLRYIASVTNAKLCLKLTTNVQSFADYLAE